MKKLLILAAASAALTGSIMAGPSTPEGKMSAPVIEVLYGTGWYGAIQAGANVYQDAGGGKQHTTRNGRTVGGNVGDGVTGRRGNTISLDPQEDVGFFAGLKLGYVFGTGFVRPAFEADIFYNGIDQNIDIKVNGDAKGSVDGRIDSIAFMGNALLRFNYEKFQPYIGFGLGYWVAEANDVTVTIKNQSRSNLSTTSQGDVAWQLIAGADYYFNPKFSTFLEYKFLNYENAVLDNAIRQQLIGAGVRFHF